MGDFLKVSWGLSGTFALQAATLYLYLWYYGLNPKILSGFRDPFHQAQERARWDAGDHSGLQVRPALDSLHCRADGSGRPASQAIDIGSSDPSYAGRVAEYLGIGWGGRFNPPDTHHFFDKKVGGGL